MTDEIEAEEYVDVRIFGIPKEDFEYFRQIVKVHEGDRVRAFRALLDSYDRERLIGQLITMIGTLEKRIDDLEEIRKFDGVKTFGGELK